MKPRVLSTNTLFAPLVALARGLIRRVRTEGVLGSRQELASLSDAIASASAGLCAGEGSAARTVTPPALKSTEAAMSA